jgi:hypothetical protein
MYNPFVTRQLNPPLPFSDDSYDLELLYVISSQGHSSFGESFSLTISVHGITYLSEIAIPAAVVYRSSCELPVI